MIMQDGLFIGGVWESSEASFDVMDPSTGEVFASVADAGGEDAVRALDAASASQASWARTAPRERSEILRRAYELMHERAEELARLSTLEIGRPIAESRGEVVYAAEFLRWFSEQAVRVEGDYRLAPGGDFRILTTRQPVGPAYLVTPWNFPLSMVTRKVGPALAAGCTMIIKPAEATPLSALALGRLLADAGVPEGVLSVLPTNRAPEVTNALIDDGRLRVLSFTGSTPVGKKLLEQAGNKVIRTTMELGGNAPFLVFDDADLDAAIDGAVLAKMRNTGESCVAANRFIVHEAVAEEFAARLAERLGALRTGPGIEPGSQVGPLIDERSRTRVAGLVSDAVERGATVRVGGKAPEGPGFFYPPTVLSGVPADARVWREEIFAPVAAIGAFADEEAMVAAANDTDAGLVAYVYTRDLKRAFRVGDALEAGMVGVNRGLVSNPAAPFGGIKESGIGREGGYEGIEDFLEVKYLAVDM
jgi:succinate-semialdehyde dehydrogenase/glutarate-semialdehyde dehydrogenase